MKRKKELLREKLIDFQLKIAALDHTLKEQEDRFKSRENALYLNLFEVLDAFENLAKTIKAKEDGFDKTTRRIAKNISSIQQKLARSLKLRGIIPVEFKDNQARMEYCKIVETRQDPQMENESILSIIKTGYLDKNSNKVLRKAEVVIIVNR